MIKHIMHNYFSKMFFICFLLVAAVTSVLSFICYSLLYQKETSDYLSDYDIIMHKQSAALTSKMNHFSNNLSFLYNDSDAYKSLCNLCTSPSGTLSETDNETLLSALDNFCTADSYCSGILLLTRFGRLYQYNSVYSSIIPRNLSRTTFRFTPFHSQIITGEQISSMNPLFDDTHVYGLSGTVYSYDNNSLNILGYIIALYSSEEFSNIINDFSPSALGNFIISDASENIIYSSCGLNFSSAYPFMPDISQKQSLITSSDGEKYYASTIYEPRSMLYNSYQVPESEIPSSDILRYFLFILLIMAAFFIIYYSIELSSFRYKIRHIQNGMKVFGENNLNYRITQFKDNNEFNSIISSFNHMCDTLQKNIDDTYFFEISQKKSELYAMQTSINPHFLYNTLEQIRVQVMQNHMEDASEMLLLLSKMYRYQTRRNLFISIGEECSQMENLINLYSYRTGYCDYIIDLDNCVRKYGILKNILQPLIENCFVHGFANENEDHVLTLNIYPKQTDNGLFIQFILENNGSSISDEELELLMTKIHEPMMNHQEDKGFALTNINNRLKLVFGSQSQLNISKRADNTGFCVSFMIPAMLPEELTQLLNRRQINI